ncbi:MAG: hypothetical protein HY424_01740 [Candidatus Levybacteria bacterium]|nr:hypothetical protein [Candidatus Levybacteria bacterium]
MEREDGFVVANRNEIFGLPTDAPPDVVRRIGLKALQARLPGAIEHIRREGISGYGPKHERSMVEINCRIAVMEAISQGREFDRTVVDFLVGEAGWIIEEGSGHFVRAQEDLYLLRALNAGEKADALQRKLDEATGLRKMFRGRYSGA